MKKLLLFVLCFISLQSVFAYDAFIDGIYYNFTQASKKASVTSGEVKYSGRVSIPEEVTFDGKVYEVSEIGADAFFDCSSLTTVDIPNSVTSIDSYAFAYCSS